MKYKSSKRKKRRDHESRRSWLQSIGTFLAGLAALLEVILQFVMWLSAK
ncbi:MAG: hypothetical protein K6G80_10030 [Treponema sp.]|nr:hypothetical protein [Treponema sp.]